MTASSALCTRCLQVVAAGNMTVLPKRYRMCLPFPRFSNHCDDSGSEHVTGFPVSLALLATLTLSGPTRATHAIV